MSKPLLPWRPKGRLELASFYRTVTCVYRIAEGDVQQRADRTKVTAFWTAADIFVQAQRLVENKLLYPANSIVSIDLRDLTQWAKQVDGTLEFERLQSAPTLLSPVLF